MTLYDTTYIVYILDPFPIIIDFLTDNPGAFTFGDRPLPERELWRPHVLPGMHPDTPCKVHLYRNPSNALL